MVRGAMNARGMHPWIGGASSGLARLPDVGELVELFNATQPISLQFVAVLDPPIHAVWA